MLFIAAVVNYRRTRHWSLALMAAAPVCFVVGFAFFWLGQYPIRGATLQQIGTGERSAWQILITAGSWINLLGVSLAAAGGLGAIFGAPSRDAASDDTHQE